MEELGDITQLLLRFSPDGLMVVDDGGRICFANETLTQLFGYAAATLIGQRMEVLLPERLRTQHERHFAGYSLNPVAREMGARIPDLFGRRADGSEFPAGIRLAPFRVGSRIFVAAAIRDMTERRRINEALMAAREEADRANRAKSRFLATASHDLRQPLQTIRLLNAAMLRIHQPDLKDILEQQSGAIDSMIRLLNALLDISRLEAGAITPEIKAVELADLLQELQAEFGPLSHTRGLELRVKSVPATIRTDRNLLLQMLQNLVGNAMKYTDQGHVAIGSVLDSEGLTISVEDTGIGIPSDKLERIFDEYYQVDTHGTKRMGVGLGLAIVREVAQLLRFTVKITLRPGGGTRAAIHVPRDQLTTSPAARNAPSNIPAIAREGRPRILLVEDNSAVRIATELFLKLEGYEVLGAGSVAEARDIFRDARVGDILITDYHLDADNTGLDLLAGLRKTLKYEIPCIVLTGDLPSLVRRSEIAPPACHYLPKPVDTQALIDAISMLSVVVRESHSSDLAALSS